jgi:hypothetical protein
MEKKKKVVKKAAPSKKKNTSEIDEIMARIIADLDQPQQSETNKKPLGAKFNIKTRFVKSPLTNLEISIPAKKIRIPAVILILILLSGFWGRDIVKVLGFPIEPIPFTALYFDDPHITETGIAVGSKVVFGINNGSSEQRTFNWKAKLSDRKISSSSVTIEPYTERKFSIAIKNASPGDFLEISVDKLKTPIAVVVTG